jgi:phosphatidylserine decarboxylase
LVARRILCYANESDSLARGQRYGFIRFGSRVDLYLPTTATSKVSVGDVTMGGVTSVAELNG